MTTPKRQVAVPFSVLLLEQESARRQMLVDRLEGEGIDVLTCEQVDEALSILAWHRSSIAILGTISSSSLPIEAAERLRSRASTLRIVMLGPFRSGDALPDEHTWLHAAPANDPHALAMMVHRLLNQTLQEELVSREDRYRTLLSTTGSVIVHLTADLRIQEWNPAAEELFGYRRAEVLGRNYVDRFITESLREPMIRSLKEVIGGGALKGNESRVVARDGSERTVIWNITRLENAEGEAGILAVGQDITARQELEEKLRDAQRLQRRINEAVPEHIYLYDLPDERTIYSNRKMERILGYAEDDLPQMTGDHFQPRLLHEDPGAFEAMLEQLEGDVVVTTMHRLQHRDDSWRTLRARNVLFARDRNGSVRQFLGLLQDVTESQRADEALRASREELRRLAQHLQSVRDEERTEIAREIHDQLGQELTALKIHMSVLKNAGNDLDLSDGLHETIETMSQLVHTTTESVRRLSRDLRPHPTAHLGLIQAMGWHCEEFSKQMGTPCRFQTQLDTVSISRERETHMFRILQEALTNVARHSGASSVEVELEENDGNLVLTVADDGKGISEDVITTGRSVGLTGMRERAHLCGGEVTIFCAPGAGTIIVARVPESESQEDAATGTIVFDPALLTGS